MPPQEEQIIDDSQVHAFIRGEASEHIITTLANIRAAQVPIKTDGIIATQKWDITSKVFIEDSS